MCSSDLRTAAYSSGDTHLPVHSSFMDERAVERPALPSMEIDARCLVEKIRASSYPQLASSRHTTE